MTKKILIDTNAYSNLLSGSEIILDVFSQAEKIYVSVVVLGELYAGFKGGNKEAENIKILSRFLEKPTVQIIDITKETAEIFGEIKNNLKIAGTPLPINDIWIAAHAFEVGAQLITFDQHFVCIPGLRIFP
ncbi:MAG: type II toxin-antitoxin system VapC family toxin [Candidatus Margulisiibacteriota bacterium]